MNPRPAPPPAEPTPETLTNPVLRYLFATRPAFLTITLVGCVLGFATAHASGARFDGELAAWTLLLAVVAHAGINVFNDYYDALSGTDALNTERVFPFTGGSRFIQNGVFTPGETATFAIALFLGVIAAGGELALMTGPGLWAIGGAGLAIGWAYSAPPFKLASRGLGEVCVAAGFALIVVGSHYVQRGAFDTLAFIASVPYGLLVSNILYINQFPDHRADAASGKRNWVVRLTPSVAHWFYLAMVLAAALWIALFVFDRQLPPAALFAMAALWMGVKAHRELAIHAADPPALLSPIKQTILLAHLVGLLLAAAIWFTAP